MYPMDFEEFNWALGDSVKTIRRALEKNILLSESINNKLMRDFRIYMAIGGMPRVVSAYLKTNSLEAVDKEKRDIISLYQNDLKKNDSSGRLSDIYMSIPSQLALKRNRFKISEATSNRKRLSGQLPIT